MPNVSTQTPTNRRTGGLESPATSMFTHTSTSNSSFKCHHPDSSTCRDITRIYNRYDLEELFNSMLEKGEAISQATTCPSCVQLGELCFKLTTAKNSCRSSENIIRATTPSIATVFAASPAPTGAELRLHRRRDDNRLFQPASVHLSRTTSGPLCTPCGGQEVCGYGEIHGWGKQSGLSPLEGIPTSEVISPSTQSTLLDDMQSSMTSTISALSSPSSNLSSAGSIKLPLRESTSL